MFTGTSYFEANHRKGAVDEIQETVNHAVYSHDNNSMVLGHHNKCREKAIYIPGTLKVHYIEGTFSKSTCEVRFFVTTNSKNPMKEKEHEIFQAPLNLVNQDYYLVTYEGQLWPGQLMKPSKYGGIIRCLLKATVTGSIWKWSNKPDEEEYRMEDVHQEIATSSNFGSKTSSLRASNLLVHVPELDCLYK